MEQQKNSETDGLRRGPLARLHEKIQNKYHAMQRRLNKSRSVDSIATLSDEYSFKQNRYSLNSDLSVNFSSNTDFEELNEVFESEKRYERYNIIIEHIKERVAVEESFYDEASISEVHLENNDKDYFHRLPFFGSDFKASSSESLNEIAKAYTDGGESPVPSSPPPKMSLRYRIGSRLAAAKNSKELRKNEKNEKVEKLVLTNSPKDTLKKKQKTATVNIALIDASELGNESASEEKMRVLHCRFRLGSEKRKSKTVKTNTATATFQELFTISVCDEYLLQITLCEGSNVLGKTLIDLLEVKKEKTHKMRTNLEDGTSNFKIFFLLTLTGTSLDNTFSDFDEYQGLLKENQAVQRTNMWSHLRGDFHDVGRLTIVVYGAKGLSTNESYCIVQVGNERLYTHSVSKTQAPRWNKMFVFDITDVTSILEVTVMDEKKSEVVGKIAIYLLKIHNGDKKWYALKDSTLREAAKGNNPRILLEMNLHWSLIKASVRVINPKEVKFMETEPKFHRQLFARNLSRARAVLNWVFKAIKVLKTMFEWESRKWNTIALTTWLLFCWFFKAWMVPLLLLSPFLWYRQPEYILVNWKKYVIDTKDSDKDNQDKEDEKKSLRQKFHTLQDMIQTVQNAIGKFGSLGERIKNLFNFTVPFLSFLAIFFIIVITILLYLVPVNYIFMSWGIHKYLRKILKPNRIPNNEILDLLSRVPDDEILIDCQELQHEHDCSPTESDIFKNDNTLPT